eukprot:COSAG02_NODE_554_length_20414_cov_67.356535_5_plen_69_part_00
MFYGEGTIHMHGVAWIARCRAPRPRTCRPRVPPPPAVPLASMDGHGPASARGHRDNLGDSLSRLVLVR